jgi:hypothetical protein
MGGGEQQDEAGRWNVQNKYINTFLRVAAGFCCVICTTPQSDLLRLIVAIVMKQLEKWETTQKHVDTA